MAKNARTGMISNRRSMEHKDWGEGCAAWDLMATSGLSVKHEEMPPGTAEVRHHHSHAEQFFFVLSGELVLEISGTRHRLSVHDGIIVAPEERHQAICEGPNSVEFLVVSAPPTAGDRIDET